MTRVSQAEIVSPYNSKYFEL